MFFDDPSADVRFHVGTSILTGEKYVTRLYSKL